MTRYQCNQCTWRLINSPRGARKKKKKVMRHSPREVDIKSRASRYNAHRDLGARWWSEWWYSAPPGTPASALWESLWKTVILPLIRATVARIFFPRLSPTMRAMRRSVPRSYISRTWNETDV